MALTEKERLVGDLLIYPDMRACTNWLLSFVLFTFSFPARAAWCVWLGVPTSRLFEIDARDAPE